MVFCTVITPDYLHYALALRESLIEFNSDVCLYIFVSEADQRLKERFEKNFHSTYLLFPEDICTEGLGKAIYDKYANTYKDGFRWSIKPVLLTYLLNVKGLDKVIYVDCDIHFFSDYSFLFDELEESSVLLTPHWRSIDPSVDEVHFFQLYIFGLYNAGFIGVNTKALSAMKWWAQTNLFICEVDASRGQYVDQSHLNLLPIYFDGVKSLKHRGCNVAGWNRIECNRERQHNGEILINNVWKIVFIHFSHSTIYDIQMGDDELLKPHLQVYLTRLQLHNEQPNIPLDKTHVVQHIPPKQGTVSKLFFKFKHALKHFN